MRKVTFEDLQYKREKECFKRLMPVLENLQNKYKKFSIKTQQQEKQFFNLLSHSIKIDRLKNISNLINKINERLNTNLDINLFLHESSTSNAQCMPRYFYSQEDSCKELIILVSQHFFNNLSENDFLNG